jgi:DNA-binding transcriptional LysR family regulator
MDDLGALESFLKTVESGSFSAAAGLLGLTPAAVSKQVAKLERVLGTRLFQRTTRSLALTESGERLYAEAAGPARSLAQIMAMLTERDAQPAGTLRISVAPGFARQYILPLLPEFLARYPAIQLDWSFENRHIDLVREGFDAAIGSGVAVDANVVARELIPLHMVTVASPDYLARHGQPQTLDDLRRHDCIRLRSATTGRLREWTFLHDGESVSASVTGRMVFTDLDAMLDATLAGMGLARLGAHHVLPHLDSGRLVALLPAAAAPAGSIHVYYTHYRLTPPKVRAFVDFLTESLVNSDWARRIRTMASPR